MKIPVSPVVHALTENSTPAKNEVKRSYIYPSMSLLPQYREPENHGPTGEAGSMKKSNFLSSLSLSLSRPCSTLPSRPTLRYLDTTDIALAFR